jgi:hypothetical protein
MIFAATARRLDSSARTDVATPSAMATPAPSAREKRYILHLQKTGQCNLFASTKQYELNRIANGRKQETMTDDATA